MWELERKCGLVYKLYNSFDVALLTKTGRGCKGAVTIHDNREVKPNLAIR